jgi:hypothetical protein
MCGAARAELLAEPASLSFRSNPGPPPPSARLSVTSVNPASGLRFQVSASSDGNGTWLTAGLISGVTPASVTVSANPEGLAPGVYRGSITLTAEGARTVVPVTLAVPEVRLSVSPEMWAVTHEAGSLGGPSQAFAIRAADAEGNPIALRYKVEVAGEPPGAPRPMWLSVSTLGSETPGLATAAIHAALLAQGTYAGALLITAEGAINSPLRVPVRLNLIAPRLSPSESRLIFNYRRGEAAPAPVSFFVNSTGSPLSFRVTASTESGIGWLRADPETGFTAGLNLVNVSVAPADLPRGVHRGWIRIESEGASNSPAVVAVSLTVRDEATLFARPTALTFVSYVLRSGGRAEVEPQTLRLSGSLTRFTATALTTSGGDWLQVSPGSGVTPRDLALTANPEGLGPGTYSGVVRIQAPSAANPRVDIPVSLTISGAPLPVFSTTSIRLEATAGAARAVTGEFLLTGRFQFITSTSAPWLRATPGAGSVGQIDTRTGDITPTTNAITVYADPSRLTPGTYTGEVVLTLVENSAEYAVPVTFTVRSAPLVMPQIIDGGGGKTSILLVNADVEPASYALRFWQDSGQPYPLALAGEGVRSATADTIPAGGLRVIETQDASEDGSQGWGELESGRPVGGTVVFRRRGPGVPESEAAIPVASPIGRRFSMAFDNTEGFITAMALVNPHASQSATIDVTLRDEDGAPLSTGRLALGPHEHTAFALPAQFAATGARRGVAEFSSTQDLAALGLRFNPGGAFTSVEPAPRALAGEGVTTHLLPQLVDGAGSQTTILLVNPGDQPVPFSMAFHRPDGGPLALRIAGLGAVTEHADIVPAGGVRVIETGGDSSPLGNPLVQGWGEIVAARPLSGTLIFRLGDSEAGVPVGPPVQQRAVLPFDNTNGFVTAMAVVNPSPDSPQTLFVRLLDEAGQPIRTEAVSLPAGSRQAFALPDRFPVTANLRGTLEFQNPGVGVLALRFNPRGSLTAVNPVLK